MFLLSSSFDFACQNEMMNSPRADKHVDYISPEKEVNAGLWTLFAGASVFLGLRIWCKYTRRTGLWYDDYVLILSWVVLMVTDIIITIEYATGYVAGNWDDRMHILINVTSCGTLMGQSWSKTALGITLLRMSDKKQTAILWFCIGSMNIYMLIKIFFQWAKYCGKSDYQNWYNLQGPCLNYDIVQNFKVGGNTYNIIMDFVFAAFPWWITWHLEMRRIEKIALCATMSLGMIIAIISAIRTTWKDRPIMHVHDDYYMWRNGMSNIWYSAEVAGTIIVQCIPILRPFIRDIKSSLASKRNGDTEEGTSMGRSRRSTLPSDLKRGFDAPTNYLNNNNIDDTGKKGPEVIALHVIPEELDRKESYSSEARSETAQPAPMMPAGPLSRDSWRLSGSERTDLYSPALQSPLSGNWRDSMMDFRFLQPEAKGLSPPPPRGR